MMVRIRAMLEKVADWLDDRWTWAAIGLLTGYFGFGSADSIEWRAWEEVGIALASLVLILVRDRKRRVVETQPAGWNDASSAPEVTVDAKPEATESETLPSFVDRRASATSGRLRYPVPPIPRSNTAEAVDRNPPDNHPAGWNDRGL